MSEIVEKHVDFHAYCKSCKYWSKSESESPCFECLENPVNVYSHKPVRYVKAEKPAKPVRPRKSRKSSSL